MSRCDRQPDVYKRQLDDFYSGNSEDIKKNALFKEMYRWIDNSVHLNVNDMFDAALRNTLSLIHIS